MRPSNHFTRFYQHIHFYREDIKKKTKTEWKEKQKNTNSKSKRSSRFSIQEYIQSNCDRLKRTGFGNQQAVA